MAPGPSLCFECLFERCSHRTWFSRALPVQRPRPKSGPACLGQALDAETVPVLCFQRVALWAPGTSSSDQVGPRALVSCGLISPGHRVPRVHPRACPPPSVCVWARLHKQCNCSGPAHTGARCLCAHLRALERLFMVWSLQRSIYCLTYLWGVLLSSPTPTGPGWGNGG